jgi:hypothetical protein
MVWFRVDDSFYDHPKVVSIPRSVRAQAIGTWTLAGNWCAKQLTDGVLPAHQVEEVGGTAAGAQALVKAKLWIRTKTGFRFKNWDEYQPTRAQVEATRESERTRKARQRAKPSGQQTESDERPDGSPAPVPPGQPVGHQQVSEHPVPSRPGPAPDSHVSQSSHVPDREETTDDDADRSRRNGYWRGWRISNPDRMVALIAGHVDRPVTEDQAIVIISGLLAKANPKNPIRSVQAYVEGCIAQSWPEIQRDLDAAAGAA